MKKSTISAATNESLNVKRILIDTTIKKHGDAANQAATKITKVMDEKQTPVVGFMIDPKVGMFMLLDEEVAKAVQALIHSPLMESFDMEAYVKTTNDDFWLVEYDTQFKPTLKLYTKNKKPAD